MTVRLRDCASPCKPIKRSWWRLKTANVRFDMGLAVIIVAGLAGWLVTAAMLLGGA